MNLLHFTDTNSEKEYIVITHSDEESEWLDHAKPGYVLETVSEIGAEKRGLNDCLPSESPFIAEPF